VHPARRFTQVDVFTHEPLLGNPVAVIHDSDGLDGAAMQRFTAWTNLSEATFLSPPTDPAADYAVRIFTAGGELPFAGHPTLGSCHAWLEAGGVPQDPSLDVIVQECPLGLVPVHRDRTTDQLFFRAPERRRSGPLVDADVGVIAAGLGVDRSDIVDHQWCDNGPPWRAVMLRSAADVARLTPDASALGDLWVGVIGPHSAGADAQFAVRAFLPGAQGLCEDPVTGSLNAALGQWLIGAGRADHRYVATQGEALGRSGRVTVEQIGADVWVGGGCVSVVHGTVAL
jgi:PhzF family phenazine biosynthesis protein